MTATVVLIETVGVIAFITNVWANLLIARKNETGWIVRLLANGLWLAFGIAAISIANILSSLTFTVINIYALRRWRRERLNVPSTMKCNDHYRIDCCYCTNIIRQCRCHIGTDKPVTRDGICNICVKQLLPAQEHAA